MAGGDKRHGLVAVLVLAVLLVGGCSGAKRVFPGWGSDPVGSAVQLVESGMEVAEIEWYRPACVDDETPADFCDVWASKVVPAIAAAIDRAEAAYALALADLDANQLALAAVSQAQAALRDIAAIGGGDTLRDICRHVETALVLLRGAMRPPAATTT